jgi:hypothetical protein
MGKKFFRPKPFLAFSCTWEIKYIFLVQNIIYIKLDGIPPEETSFANILSLIE